MISTRRLPFRVVALTTLWPAGLGAVWAFAVFLLYYFAELQFLRIPFLPLGTIGTAVAFYLGFKNNSAYDRFWEGRKIWGGIVNESRTWANYVINSVYPGDDSPEAHAARKDLIYRHLAYINALRLQLRRKSRFEDTGTRLTVRRLEKHRGHMRNDWDTELAPFLSPEELAQTHGEVNAATQLQVRQSAALQGLQRTGKVDLFHQLAMLEVVRAFYGLQGKAERIKATPFPRQYAETGRVFVRTFVALVPFGLLDVFAEHIHGGTLTLESFWPALPMVASSALITWVFLMMEGVGDSSEDPFERSINDVPMNALCRVIERDLRQMLGETELPEPEPVAEFILY